MSLFSTLKSLCQVKIDTIGIYQTPFQPRVRNKQKAQERAQRGFDGLDVIRKVLICLPLTTELRQVCESSHPLAPSQAVFHLNGFWYAKPHRSRCYTIGAKSCTRCITLTRYVVKLYVRIRLLRRGSQRSVSLLLLATETRAWQSDHDSDPCGSKQYRLMVNLN